MMTSLSNRWSAVVGLVVALGLLVLAGCAAPRVNLQSATLKQLTTRGLQIGMNLDLYNPNDFALPLQTIDWRLELFESPFTSGTAKFTRQIPARDRSRIEVPLGISFADVAGSVERVLSSRTIPWGIGGKVNFRTPAGPIHVSFENSGSWRNPLF